MKVCGSGSLDRTAQDRIHSFCPLKKRDMRSSLSDLKTRTDNGVGQGLCSLWWRRLVELSDSYIDRHGETCGTVTTIFKR